MSKQFEISFTAVGPVCENDDGQPPGDLSFSNLLILFPSRVTISGPTKSAFVFEDVSLLGLLMDLTELWEEVEKGQACADVYGFYGGYHLILRSCGDVLKLEDEFQDACITTRPEDFAREVMRWKELLLREMERVHPGLLESSEYEDLRSSVEEVWEKARTALDLGATSSTDSGA